MDLLLEFELLFELELLLDLELELVPELLPVVLELAPPALLLTLELVDPVDPEDSLAREEPPLATDCFALLPDYALPLDYALPPDTFEDSPLLLFEVSVEGDDLATVGVEISLLPLVC